MTHLAPFAAAGAGQRAASSRTSASSTTPRSPTTSRSSRRCRRRSGLSEAEQKLYDLVVAPLPGGVLPARRIPGHDPHLAQPSATASGPRARCWSSRAGSRSTARKPRGEDDEATSQTLVPVKPGEMVRAETVEPQGRSRRGRRRATRKRRCSARWKAPASWSRTTSCARRCRRRASARRPRARRSSKA